MQIPLENQPRQGRHIQAIIPRLCASVAGFIECIKDKLYRKCLRENLPWGILCPFFDISIFFVTFNGTATGAGRCGDMSVAATPASFVDND